jgi:hypothetical protein
LSSSGNHTVPLIGHGKLLGYLVQKRDLADWYGLKLASNIPDQGSGMKWNIRVIAYLIEYGNGRCGLYRLAYALIHEVLTLSAERLIFLGTASSLIIRSNTSTHCLRTFSAVIEPPPISMGKRL